MKLEKIISMANKAVELEFLAMERSLRSTGCTLPIWVIPYNEDLFELPEGSLWWNIPELQNWLASQNAMNKLRKYQCFLTSNYQFVDSDVCFLRNPVEVLESFDGFITSCLHWSNPIGTYTEESLKHMQNKTTLWPSMVFNSGQFACSEQLYELESLTATAVRPDFIQTCMKLWRDQPGINMLVFASGVKIQNLTLPPINMESTWSGDYRDNYLSILSNNETKPYIIHWAGRHQSLVKRINAIDDIFFSFLTDAEKEIWKAREIRSMKNRYKKFFNYKQYGRKVKNAFKVLIS